MKYQHFVLTQFNLRNFPKSQIQSLDSWITWTRNRIPLFEKYCLPAMLSQSCKYFVWVLFFDKETPEEFFPFIKKLKKHPFIKICFMDGASDFEENHIKTILSLKEPDYPWVATSRIDNDDAFHVDAIAEIQKHIVLKNNYMISLASGYVYDANSGYMSHYHYPMSPFLTLVEDGDQNPKGIFSKGHTSWPKLRLWVFKELWIEWFKPNSRKVRFVLRKPFWVQVVHGKNVSNSFFRGLPVSSPPSLKTDFTMNETPVPYSPLYFYKYTHYVIWKRYFKCWIIKSLIGK